MILFSCTCNWGVKPGSVIVEVWTGWLRYINSSIIITWVADFLTKCW
jgi:hypothetical protein